MRRACLLQQRLLLSEWTNTNRILFQWLRRILRLNASIECSIPYVFSRCQREENTTGKLPLALAHRTNRGE
jgi:hypothetical protein